MSTDRHHDLNSISMMELFRMEADNHCAILADNLLALEQDPDAPETLEALMRSAHSTKGAARIVELHGAVKLAHAMEDVFVACQAGKIRLNRQHIDSLLAGVDMLSAIARLSDSETDGWFAAHAEEIGVLCQAYQLMAGQQGQVCPPQNGPAAAPEAAAPLANKAGQEEGGRAAISELQSLSMLELFRVEAEKHCQVLNDQILILEREPAAPESLESSMRAAHSIKGAARIVELDAVVRLAHVMEDLFVASQRGAVMLDRERIDTLFAAIDILFDLSRQPAEVIPEIISSRQDTIEGLITSLLHLAKPSVKAQKQDPAPPVQPAAVMQQTEHPPFEVISSESAAPRRASAAETEAKETARSIRISAENMSRLMGLAGEVLIESRWLPTFSTKMQRLKRQQDELLKVLDKLYESQLNLGRSRTAGNRLLELRKRIEACRQTTLDNIAIVEFHARHSTEISHHLYHEAIASRMLPFSEGIKGFPRLVRDVARELGKEVRFEVIGAETPVDRDILEKMEAPLNHLLRNAIDHGIETPEQRQACGKKREAVIRLEARHRSGMLNIIVSDDGRGVDLDKIRQVVVDKKLVAAEIARDLTDSELIEFLFLPNFSTRDSVSKISGRGVGLDVVRSVIHEIRGVIYSSSRPGQGTSFELQLPLTLSVMRALIVEISREPYAIPLVNINRIIRVAPAQIREIQGRQYFTFNEKRIGLLSGQQILQTATLPHNGEDFDVVVYSDRMNQYGLIVDRFWGIRDLVVQALDPRLGKIKDISAASVLEDGTPVLIVDVEDMVRSMDLLISDNQLRRVGDDDEKKTRNSKRILVADDSITVREVERKMLAAKGYEVDVAVDGMDAWNTLRGGNYNLLVTDVDMPRMNGIELVTQLKKEPRLASLPVIIVSYKDREEDRNRGLDAGADYYLTKGSFQDHVLVNAVRDLIGGPEAMAA